MTDLLEWMSNCLLCNWYRKRNRAFARGILQCWMSLELGCEYTNPQWESNRFSLFSQSHSLLWIVVYQELKCHSSLYLPLLSIPLNGHVLTAFNIFGPSPAPVSAHTAIWRDNETIFINKFYHFSHLISHLWERSFMHVVKLSVQNVRFFSNVCKDKVSLLTYIDCLTSLISKGKEVSSQYSIRFCRWFPSNENWSSTDWTNESIRHFGGNWMSWIHVDLISIRSTIKYSHFLQVSQMKWALIQHYDIFYFSL